MKYLLDVFHKCLHFLLIAVHGQEIPYVGKDVIREAVLREQLGQLACACIVRQGHEAATDNLPEANMLKPNGAHVERLWPCKHLPRRRKPKTNLFGIQECLKLPWYIQCYVSSASGRTCAYAL